MLERSAEDTTYEVIDPTASEQTWETLAVDVVYGAREAIGMHIQVLGELSQGKLGVAEDAGGKLSP
jgi:hypothetical protein